MANASFAILEHKLPERIGLPLEEIRVRRNERLVKGEDWERIGRWVKYSEAGLAKLMAQIGVEQLAPAPKPPEWREAVVTRCNFPNKHLIEVAEKDGPPRRLVRIPPAWHPSYKQKMAIKILVADGQAVATTRRPRGRYQF